MTGLTSSLPIRSTYDSTIVLNDEHVRFETTCEGAYEYLRKLPHFFDRRVRYRFSEVPLVKRAPVLRYEDRPSYSMSFDYETDQLTLAAPWSRVPTSTLLRMSLWFLAELVRQRQGHYLLHASAVVRGGSAIVLLGGSESGKTTMALELCRNHGCQLFANDQVLVSLRDGIPTLLRGDTAINLRLASLEQYSSNLAARVFGSRTGDASPWQVKKLVQARELEIEVAEGEYPIGHLVFVKLDRHASRTFVQEMLETPGDTGEPSRDALLMAKVTLYQELSGLIRGAHFAPFDADLEYVDLFVPSLDDADLQRRRVALLNALFSCVRVTSVRGQLAGVVESLVSRTQRM